MTNTVARNNVTITGTGRPMVFAHGFGCSQEMWRYVAPEFETDHRVVLFDHVGAGRSDVSAYKPGKYDSLDGYARDVLEILEELDLRDVVFVGHSVSAIIGILAANHDPSRFGALVLVAPSPRYINDESTGYVGGFTSDEIAALLDSLDANHFGWSAAMAPVIMGTAGRTDLDDELTESFCNTDAAIARHFARVTFLSDNRRDLTAVSVPTLVLQCSDDVIAPVSVGEFVAESIPGSTLTQLETTGHCPHMSGPAEVVAAVRHFLG